MVALELVDSLNITLVTCPPARVARLALLTGLTGHDAAYLYTALSWRCPLVTFDQHLARAARLTTRV
jgi:predicted nucleic acid-binding protein